MSDAKLGLALGVLSLLEIGLAASAHKPVTIGRTYSTFEDALRIEEIDVSQVAYTELTDKDRALWLVSDGKQENRRISRRGSCSRPARKLPAKPGCDRPELPAIDVPFQIPAGTGGVLFETLGIDSPEAFHEPVTGTDSWILLEASLETPQAGMYYVVAWRSGEPAGKLSVAIGAREQFGLSDFVSFRDIVRDVRAFHEIPSPPRTGATLDKVVFLGLVAAILLLLASPNRGQTFPFRISRLHPSA